VFLKAISPGLLIRVAGNVLVMVFFIAAQIMKR
jgi:hypothetical protein